MGNVQSESTKQIQKDFTDFINKNNSTFIVSTGSQCVSSNTVSFLPCTVPNYTSPNIGNVTINQKAFSNCSVKSNTKVSSSSKFSAQLTTTLNQFAEQANKSSQGWLATGFNVQNAVITNKQQLVTHIVNVTSTYTQSRCDNATQDLNKAIVYLCGDFSGIDIDQSATTTAVTSCIFSGIVNAFSNDQVLQQFVQGAQQYQVSTLSGIFSILAGLFGLILIFGALGLIFGRNKSNQSDQSNQKDTEMQNIKK